jgi:glycosyltransferase involved in cell wall biosynthesis
MNNLEIAYVLFRFPHLTETFIAEEIHKIQNKGVKLQLYSLLQPVNELVHPISMELLPQVRYAPGILHPLIWGAQFHFLTKVGRKYFRLLWLLLTQPSPNFSTYLKRLVVFLKAVWLAKELEQTSVQLIHTHFAWLSSGASMVVSQLLDLPFTVTAHAFDIYSQKNDLLNLTTSLADRVITISEYNKQAILDRNKFLDSNKIEVIRCGIDLDLFLPKSEISDNQILQITSVGSLIEKKGHEYLISACAKLAAKGVDFRCVIVGEGHLRNSLQALIEELKLEDMVTLVGAQAQTWVRDRLSRTDMFVLACVVEGEGERDGIPVAMMEALATGIPVISTTVSGIPELIKHEKTGLLVPQRNVDALTDAIACMAQSDELAQFVSQEGRSVIEKEYDISKNVSRLIEFFQMVVEEREE